MKNRHPATPESTTAAGVLFGAAAYLIWGISPIYWKVLIRVPALEIITHRIVWSFVFLMPLVIVGGQWPSFLDALKNRRTLLILLCSSLFVAANWLIYIWAVTHDRLLQASLGYYINPLVNVLLGMVFLKERLRRAQAIAVIMATAAVAYLTVSYGVFPWISLSLAFSFGLYGLIRKVAPVGSLTGLTIETLVLSVPGWIYLYVLDTGGAGAFLHSGPAIDLLLIGASVVTALPLLFFTIGARRLNLSTMGFLQYIAPTCMFLLGVLVYGEPFRRAQLVTFLIIWTALAVYSADSVITFRKLRKTQNGTG